MELARRRTLGFAAATLAALMALVLALAVAPGRALAGDTYTVEIGNYKNDSYVLGDYIGASTILYDNGIRDCKKVESPLSVSFSSEGSQVITFQYLNYNSEKKDAGPYTATCTKNSVAVDSVTVSPGTLDLVVGGAKGTLAATVLPEGASQDVTWKSSDESVATVSGQGVVTPVGAGTATITATSAADQTKSATCKVTVKGTHTLTLKASPTDGGTVTAEPAKDSYSAGESAKITATPKEGWKFVGWDDVSGIKTPNGPTATFEMPESDVKATAVFEQVPAEPKEPKVSVEPEGAGTVDVKHDAESKNWVLTAKANSGWTFKCWRENGEEIKANPYSVDESLSHDVVAVFEKAAPAEKFAITFDANGGTGTMDKQAAEAGATVALTANAFKRDGYTFAGWNTAKDGSGTKYADKAEVKVEGDMTLYAQWTKKAAAKSSAKTGDTIVPVAIVAVIAIFAAGALLVARRKMG